MDTALTPYRAGHADVGRGMVVAALGPAHTQHQRRAGACAHHAVRLVLVEHRQRKGTVQLRHRGLQGREDVAFVE